MNCTKKITITGYLVRYVDLREPRHQRATHEEIYTVDTDGLNAFNIMGVNVADFIEARYARGGYHVTSVERLTPKRVAVLDLCRLWEEAEPPISEEAPATPDSEVTYGEA